ncbi:hypothetical protein ACQ5SK_03905 [Bradyrhizobium japonicum]
MLGPQAPPDQGSASLMGAAVLGTGAMMLPVAQGLGAALLAGSTVAALTRPAFPATISSDAKVADGSVFSNGAAPYQPFDVNVPVQRLDDGWRDTLEPSASTFADRFGNWTDTPAGTMPAQNVQQAPTPPAAGAVAPEEVRRLTRVNATNASSVFTSGSAPVPYLPSTEFNDRFGSWSMPTGEGRAQQANMPIGAFAEEPPYIIPPPIFGWMIRATRAMMLKNGLRAGYGRCFDRSEGVEALGTHWQNGIIEMSSDQARGIPRALFGWRL